jgi:hypothetical protein
MTTSSPPKPTMDYAAKPMAAPTVVAPSVPPRPIGKRLAQPSFIAVATILLIAAVGLNATVSTLKLRFQKKPVELSVYGKELTTLPMDLGPWKMVSHDGRLNEDVEHALGTKQYVFRDYVDERIAGPDMVRRLREMNDEDRFRALYELQSSRKTAVVNLAVTYYTGMVDTVAHVPDRCYIADGYQPTEYVHKTWPTKPSDTAVRFITFEDQTGMGKIARNVAYFFIVNDQQTSDPLGVRMALQNLAEEHGYYSKVELMVARADARTAEATMADFMTYAKPEIMSCLPDWQRVKAVAQ